MRCCRSIRMPVTITSLNKCCHIIEVGAANGVSARFVLDTGAPQTRVNIDTAKRMGIKLLPDSFYRYSTFYGERAWLRGWGTPSL